MSNRVEARTTPAAAAVDRRHAAPAWRDALRRRRRRGRATPTAAAAAARRLGTARRISASASISNTTGAAGQLVGLAPARMQLADEADARGRRARSRRCGPGCSAGCARRHEASRRRGANSASRSPLTSKKSTARSALAPLQRRRPGRRRGRRAAAAGARRPRRRRRPARSASRRNTLPSSNTRTRVALRARLTRSTSTRLPTRLERITDSGCGDRVEHADRLGVAGEVALPALVDEAEVDGLLLAEVGQRAGAARRRPRAPRSARAATSGAERRRARQRVVAEDADHLLDQVFLDPQVEAPARRRRPSIVPGALVAGEAEARPSPPRTRPASPACRSPWRRARRAASPAPASAG